MQKHFFFGSAVFERSGIKVVFCHPLGIAKIAQPYRPAMSAALYTGIAITVYVIAPYGFHIHTGINRADARRNTYPFAGVKTAVRFHIDTPYARNAAAVKAVSFFRFLVI